MQSITKALSGISEPDLQGLVGRNTINLLNKIDEKNVLKTALVSLILKKYDRNILFDGNIRKHLIWSLDKNEIAILAEAITGKSDWEDNWDRVIEEPFGIESLSIKKLHTYFNLEYFSVNTDVNIQREAETELMPVYPLYPYQEVVVHKTLECIFSSERRVMIHMPTGSGKTRSAMNIICRYLCARPHTVVVWLAHSEELCDQASDEFEKAWKALGNRPLSLGRYYAEHDFNLSSFRDGLIVAGLQKMYSRSGNRQSEFLKLKHNVGLVVIDEAHQAIAPTYKHLLGMLAPYGGAALVGLSATPGRSWLDLDEDAKLSSFFNGCKIKLEIEGYSSPINYLQDKGYLAIPEYRHIPYKPSLEFFEAELDGLSQGFDLSSQFLKKLGEEEARNFLIIDAILQEVKKEFKIVVFACSVSNANLLADVLLLKGVNAKTISADSGPIHRRQSIESFKSTEPNSVQVLVNYGILTTGFDAPKTKVVVVARPTQSVVLYSQMIGRAMRGSAVGGNERCKVITVVDDLPGFRSVNEGFSHWEDVWGSTNIMNG